MKKLIANELKSNLFRLFKKEYAYENMVKDAMHSNLCLFISLILINLLLICASLTADAIDLAFNLPYWLTLITRAPVVLLAILNFQIWQNRTIWFIDLIVLLASLFIPIWTIFLLVYLIFRTYLETIFMDF